MCSYCYTCVLILLCVLILVSAIYVRILLHMCPHTAMCFLILLCMCPHTSICVLILLCMCPHTAMHVSAYCYICPHTAIIQVRLASATATRHLVRKCLYQARTVAGGDGGSVGGVSRSAGGAPGEATLFDTKGWVRSLERLLSNLWDARSHSRTFHIVAHRAT